MAAFGSKQRLPSPRNADFANSAFADSAFEPQSDFVFGEVAHDDDEFRTMQRNISSLCAEGAQQSFQPMDSVNSDSMMPPGFVNPFIFEQGDLSSNSGSWPVGQGPGDFQPLSTQADIVNARSGATYSYGQVTPPDDFTSRNPSNPRQSLRFTPPTHAVTSVKSERARNAANQRHAKTKQARKDSVGKVESAGEDEMVHDKRDKYREKNRLAAAKCRAKKKNNTEDLELSARAITADNTKLRAEERELRDLFSSLRNQALAHDPSQGCNCHALHIYNANKAQEAARGATGLLHGTMPSPSAGSMNSAAASPVVGWTSSTAPSFSAGNPSLANHPAPTRSEASPIGYLPQTTAEEMMQQMLATTRSNHGNSTTATGEDGGFHDYLQRSSDGHHPDFQR